MATPQRILIVDDEPHVLVVVAASLRRHGYDVVAAESGISALEAIARMHAAGRLPAAIISDLNMPAMSGDEMAERLFAEPLLAGIPVIVVTGRTDEVTHTLSPNVRCVVRKPFSPRQLIDELVRQLPRQMDGSVTKEAA